MKQQGLAEPLKGESYEQSTLKSELAKKEKFIKELEKEIEVICNYSMYVYVCVHNYGCTYVRMYMCSYIFYVVIIAFNLTIVNNPSLSL